jgi:hypothetical protein
VHFKCQVCEEKTHLIGNEEPDDDWERLVTWKRRTRWLAEQIADVIPGPKNEEPLPIFEEGGLFWISDWELRRSGVTPPADRHMFLFRANGHIWETQGWYESSRLWWIEEVCLEEEK